MRLAPTVDPRHPDSAVVTAVSGRVTRVALVEDAMCARGKGQVSVDVRRRADASHLPRSQVENLDPSVPVWESSPLSATKRRDGSSANHWPWICVRSLTRPVSPRRYRWPRRRVSRPATTREAPATPTGLACASRRPACGPASTRARPPQPATIRGAPAGRVRLATRPLRRSSQRQVLTATANRQAKHSEPPGERSVSFAS